MGPTDKSPGSDSQGVAGDRGNRWGLLQCCTAAAPESHRPHPPDSGVPPDWRAGQPRRRAPECR